MVDKLPPAVQAQMAQAKATVIANAETEFDKVDTSEDGCIDKSEVEKLIKDRGMLQGPDAESQRKLDEKVD